MNAVSAFAQMTPCAAEMPSKELQDKFEKALIKVEKENEVSTWNIPVRFTVCQKDDGTGWAVPITEAFLDTYLADMNSKMSGGDNIYNFFRCGPANYVNSTQMYSGAVLPSNYSYVKGILNIYLYRHIGQAASATYPFALIPNVVYLTSGDFDVTYGTGFHELGHSLGLYHTFEPGEPYVVPVAPNQIDHPDKLGGRELVITDIEPLKEFSTPNHDNGGDRVYDTPAGCGNTASYWPSSASIPGCLDNNPATPCVNYCLDNDVSTPCIPGCSFDLVNCKYIGDYRDYNYDLITDPDDILVKNYMSYTGTCRQQFTLGQIERADLMCSLFLDGYYQDELCSTLNDKVEIEGTDIGLSRVRLRIEPVAIPDDYTQTVAGPDGTFNGKLPVPVNSTLVKADVRRYKEGDLNVFDDNWLYGLSTFDLVAISKHILGLEILENGYKLLAADANKSNAITSFDIVEFRKLILGVYDKLPAYNQPWRFIPESVTQSLGGSLQPDFDGVNNDDPFSTFVPSLGETSALDYCEPSWPFLMKSGTTRTGFDAVKLGNVTGGYPTEIGNECPGEVTLYVPNNAIEANKYINIKVKGFSFNEIGALQMGLSASIEDFDLVEASSEKLSGFTKDDNMGGISQGKDNIKIVWLKHDQASPFISDGDDVFTFKLKTKKFIPNLSEALTIVV